MMFGLNSIVVFVLCVSIQVYAESPGVSPGSSPLEADQLLEGLEQAKGIKERGAILSRQTRAVKTNNSSSRPITLDSQMKDLLVEGLISGSAEIQPALGRLIRAYGGNQAHDVFTAAEDRVVGTNRPELLVRLFHHRATLSEEEIKEKKDAFLEKHGPKSSPDRLYLNKGWVTDGGGILAPFIGKGVIEEKGEPKKLFEFGFSFTPNIHKATPPDGMIHDSFKPVVKDLTGDLILRPWATKQLPIFQPDKTEGEIKKTQSESQTDENSKDAKTPVETKEEASQTKTSTTGSGY